MSEPRQAVNAGATPLVQGATESAQDSSSCLSCLRLEGERDEAIKARNLAAGRANLALAFGKQAEQGEELADALTEKYKTELTTALQERDHWKGKATDWRVTYESANAHVFELNTDLEAAHARIAALEGVLKEIGNARQACLAPSDSYDIPCDCCKETARLLKAALAASPDPILGEDTRRRRDALTRSDARQRDRVRRV